MCTVELKSRVYLNSVSTFNDPSITLLKFAIANTKNGSLIIIKMSNMYLVMVSF